MKTNHYLPTFRAVHLNLQKLYLMILKGSHETQAYLYENTFQRSFYCMFYVGFNK